MQYIIDGHNLIPNIRGLTLSDLDDEQALIDVLTPFLRAKKSRAMVFFDRAATGQAGQRNFGLIKAVFVPAGQTADSAIASYIRQSKVPAKTTLGQFRSHCPGISPLLSRSCSHQPGVFSVAPALLRARTTGCPS